MNNISIRSKAVRDCEQGNITPQALYRILRATWGNMEVITKMGDLNNARYMLNNLDR